MCWSGTYTAGGNGRDCSRAGWCCGGSRLGSWSRKGNCCTSKEDCKLNERHCGAWLLCWKKYWIFSRMCCLLAKIQWKLHHFNLLIDPTSLGPGTCDTIKAQINRSIPSSWPNVKIFPSLGVVEFFRWSVPRGFALLSLTPDFQELPSAGKRRNVSLPLSKYHLMFLES